MTIELDDICFGYGREPVFRGLNLSLPDHGAVAILGENGAGKTTLLRLVSGLVFPDSGDARVLGADPTKRQPGFLSEFRIVDESPNAPKLGLRDYATMNAPFYPRFNHVVFEEYLLSFQISGVPSLTSLSTGQRKKFFLAFAFACECRMLLLDEPTNSLDIPGKDCLRGMIAERSVNGNITLIATHQTRDIENLCDHVVIIRDGRIILNSPIDVVQDALTFSISPDKADDALYTQREPGGWLSVTPGPGPVDGKPASLLLEPLFQAVSQAPEKINDVLDQERRAS